MDNQQFNSRKDAERARRLAEWAFTPALEAELVQMAEEIERESPPLTVRTEA
jgi:hypothetical protein